MITQNDQMIKQNLMSLVFWKTVIEFNTLAVTCNQTVNFLLILIWKLIPIVFLKYGAI